jgi:ubiquinone/menaquinone biosynthesis C-methylase UbiE
MTKRELEELYRDVLDELAECDFLREQGVTPEPVRLHLVEAAAILDELPPGGTVLDIGTGIGVIPRMLQRLGAQLICVDFPTHDGASGLKYLEQLGVEAHYLEVGVDELPIPDDSVDVVFVGNVIEHLPHSPRRFMSDIRRVLRPGGHLVMDTKNAIDLKTRLKLLAGISNWPTLQYIYHCERNTEHHKEYTLPELVALLELAGLRNVRGYAFEVFFTKSLRKLGTLRRMGAPVEARSQFGTGFNPWHPYEYARMPLLGLAWLFPQLRSDILAVGQK